MASVIKSVTFDSGDALALARFWATALGTDVDEDASTDRAYVEAPGWGGPNMWFVRVPEPQTAKNRMHFDLRAPDTMEREVGRLQAAGATVAERFDSHTIMRDPEGNVFCVELGPAD
jgi:Glyoxalase-like domain